MPVASLTHQTPLMRKFNSVDSEAQNKTGSPIKDSPSKIAMFRKATSFAFDSPGKFGGAGGTTSMVGAMSNISR